MSTVQGKKPVQARIKRDISVTEFTTWVYAYGETWICQCCGSKANYDELEVQ